MPNEIILNGKETRETCPVCQQSDIKIRHGADQNGNRLHDEDCSICGSSLVIVAYDCLDCPRGEEDLRCTDKLS